MKDLLLNSVLPYWAIFALVAASGAMCIFEMRKPAISHGAVRAVTLLSLAGTLSAMAVYSALGGSCIWWCTSSEYGFFSKLLRALPLFVFVAVQMGQVFAYKLFMQQYFQGELSIKGAFLSLIVVVPVAIVVYVLLDWIGLGQTARDVLFYAVLLVSLGAGVGWAMKRNVASVGKRRGLLFTAVSVVMICGGLVSLLLLLVAILNLFLQILMVAAVVGLAFFLLPKMSSADSARSDVPDSFRRDDEGHLHSTISNKEEANRKIAERKLNN